MVGPNEAGKTVVLRALQQLNKPADVAGFDVLRDYPRSLYNDISTKKVLPKDVIVVIGYYTLEDSDKALIPDEFKECTYVKRKTIDNEIYQSLENAPSEVYYKDITNNLLRLISHLDKQAKKENAENERQLPSELIKPITATWSDSTSLSGKNAN